MVTSAGDRGEILFLSAAWFERAADAARAVMLNSAASCRLRFTVEDVCAHLVVAEGRVESCGLGDLNDVHATVAWSRRDLWTIVRAGLDGNAALALTTVTAPLPDGSTYVGLPAPMNLLCRPELTEMPVIRGASLVVHYRFTNGPFGDVDYAVAIRDGHHAEEELTAPPDPDVAVTVTYRAMAEVRAGRRTILDALTNGELHGSYGSLATLAALLESPQYMAAMVATGSHADDLATLGELRADSGLRDRTRRLMANTTGP